LGAGPDQGVVVAAMDKISRQSHLKQAAHALIIAAALERRPVHAWLKEIPMMKKTAGVLFAGIVLLLSNGAVHAEDKYSAGELFADCQAIVQSSKGAGVAEELELDNTFATGTCWGAFLSLQQIVVTKKEGGKNTLLNLCVPQNATMLNMIQVFALFLQSNQKRQEEPFTKVAIAALRSAYPCKGE
jgi:hypothetical protein